MKVLNKKISRGYEFKKFKGQPSNKLEVLKLPEHLFIPLDKVDLGVKPLVGTGDNVKAGEIIWQDDISISSPVHSPVNGVVESVQKYDSYKGQVNIVKIATIATDTFKKVPGATSRWKNLTNNELGKIIYLSGTGALGSGGIPTKFKTSVIKPADVKHIIVHATGAEIYNSDISLFLKDDRAKKFTEGLSILSKLMNNTDVHLVISKNANTWFQTIENAVSDDLSIIFHRTKPKYPLNHDSILLKTILNINLPANYTGINKGVVILGIQDVCQVYEAVVEGKPLIERVVALGGSVLKDNVHIKLKIGTLVSDLTANRLLLDNNDDIRFIRNSVLSGDAMGLDSPIDKNTDVLIVLPEKRSQELMSFTRPGFNKDSYSNTFLAKILSLKKIAGTNLNGEQRACLSCGFCQDVCPVGILPDILFPYIEREMLDETVLQYGIFKCIDCNLCTYVCTAKIPIAAYLKKGKKKLLEDEYIKEDDLITSYNLIGVKEESNNEAAK